MPSKERLARKRKQEWYTENAPAIKNRKICQTKTPSQPSDGSLSCRDWYKNNAKGEKLRARKRYAENLDNEKLSKRARYSANPEPQKAKMRQLYTANPEAQKARKRQQYAANPEPKKVKTRLNYTANEESIKLSRRKRYEKIRMSNPVYFSLQYHRNVFRERARKIAAHYTNCVTANTRRGKKKGVKAGKRKPKRNLKYAHIFLGKINTEKTARRIAKEISELGCAKRLLRAKDLLKWALFSHKNCKNDLKKLFVGLQNRFNESLSKLSFTSSLENEVEALCGRSLHTSDSEPYLWEFTYRVLSGKVIVVGHEPSTAHLFPSFTSSVSAKSGLLKSTWKCNSDICFVDLHHLDKLKSFMIAVVNSSLFAGSKIITSMGEHLNQSPASSRVGVYPHSLECYSGTCVSKLPFLRTISPHFPNIRGLVSQIYKLLRIARRMMLIKRAILNQQVNELIAIETSCKEQAKEFIEDNRNESMTPISESKLHKKYQKAFELLEKRSMDTPVFPCVSCDKLLCKRQVSMLRNLKNPITGHLWQELKTLKRDECQSGYICRGCIDKLRKGEMPSTCVLNSLHVGEQPKQLSCLNSYEKILIQRAKAFQVVTKMKTVGKKNRSAQQQISKVVGKSFHLPLPLQETLKKLPRPSDPLNPNHELYVFVRGVPTKTKNVWQMLVSVDKVHTALGFLQKNNKLYCNIVLPDHPEELLSNADTHIFQACSDAKLPPSPVFQRRAILTQVTREEWDSEESHYTIHALHESKAYSNDTELYQMLKVSEPPINYENKEIDVLCFPDLYPEGKFGQFYPRGVKLTSAEFIKCRLLSKHPQFRLNQQYLFYLLHDANLRQLKQGVFHKLNVTGFKGSLSAKDCLSNLASGELEGNLTSVFSKLRNTSQYWVQPRNDVNCMAQHYGPATWFLTISPSDWNWDDMALFIREVNINISGIDSKQTSELVAMDPVSASRFIQNKFNAMMDFILSNDAPLGKVSHYFFRREYQSRGLQHFHLLLWVECAPVMGKSSNVEVAEFILKYVTCKIPNESDSPTLHSRVTSYQTHYHNSYCMRTKKTKTGFHKACRFGFPRPLTESLVLRDVVESVSGRKALKSKSRLYDLPRTPRERNINDYNPAMLLAWNGNVDIQYVGESTSILHWYVTKYTTKSEQSHVGQLFTEINSTKSLASRLFNVGLRALSNRECGALEASDTLLGIPLHGTDPETTIRWLDVGKVRRKRLLRIDKIRSMDPSSKDIFFESWVDDHYPKRPLELETMNLYDFVRWYDISVQPPKINREIHKLVLGKFLVKRTRPCLLNHYKYSPIQDPEKYYHALLLMFLCWRSTDQLKESFKTYTEAFMAKKHLLQQAVEYDDRLKEIIHAADKARDEIQNRVDELNAEEGDAADPFNEAFQLPVQTVPVSQPITDSQLIPNEGLFEELCQKLNSNQLRVFEHVKRFLLNSDGTQSVLRHFVSGVGGTGKSFLIKTITSWTKQHLQATTSISAPTGLSAYNIGGSTIYRVFQLPVEHGRTPKYRALTDDALKVLRADLNDVVLFVIDEVSMVSNLTLMYINLRMCEIFNTADQENGWFGKKHLLLFGDLLQLQPVHEGSPFIELDNDKLTSYVGSLSCINIWPDQFSYDELTINMRQAQDSEFADLLSRVRVGSMTAADIQCIESKKIHLPGKTASENLSLLGDYLSTLPDDTICLCSTGNQCAIINENMISRISGPIVNLIAKDSVDCQPRQQSKVKKILSSYDSDCSRTAGMERVIPIKVGAKVMLRRNIDVTAGLVNSAIGTVSGLKYIIDKPNEIGAITIHFYSGVIHHLQRVRVKFQVMDNAFVYREQFPISMSYAVTIHKCQGLSLKSAVIDIGESIFTCGQSYVALSRVTSSEGLHIINFNPRDVKAHKAAIAEYNRLRQKYRPDLPLYNTNCDQSLAPYVRDRKWCHSKNVQDVQDHTTVPIRSVKNTGKRLPKPMAPPTLAIRGFKNDDYVSCYANSVVQVLYSVPFIRELVKNSDQICPALKQHLQSYEETPLQEDLDTVGLRCLTDNSIYTLIEQQDCALFLLYLVETNPGLSEAFTYNTVKTTSCQRCQYTFQGQEERNNIIRVPTNAGKTTLESVFNLNVNAHWETMDDYVCSNAECGQRDSCLSKTEVTRTSRCVVMQFLIFNNQLQKAATANIVGVPNSQVVLDGKIYKPAAAIFHLGNSIEEGHFICVLKTSTGWTEANDKRIEKKKWPVGSKNIYILFLTE